MEVRVIVVTLLLVALSWGLYWLASALKPHQ